MKHTWELKIMLKEEIEKGRSWGDIVAQYYPNDDKNKLRALLWKIVNKDYDPKDNRLRERLGLVAIKRVEACVVCNEIHFACCPKADELLLPPPTTHTGLTYTRARNERLNRIARMKGYASWSAMGTAMIKEMDWVSEAADNLVELRKHYANK